GVQIDVATTRVATINDPLLSEITDFAAGAQVIAAIAGGGNNFTVSAANGAALLALGHGNGNTYLYEVRDAGADGIILEGEIALVGILEDVLGGFAAANFATL